MKVIVFGAGVFGKAYCKYADETIEILAIADNREVLWGRYLCGHAIVPPSEIPRFDYDKIVIAIDDKNAANHKGTEIIEEVLFQLEGMGVPENKIELQRVAYLINDPKRANAVKEIAQSINSLGISGAVAECGVFRGHFSALLNEYFPTRKLYLFDSFEGHSEEDVLQESERLSQLNVDMRHVRGLRSDHKYGDDKTALMRCPHRENVIIKKGYIPDTFEGLDDEKFVFANLDMDTYAPQLAGLRFFAPRMSSGGIILVHDYYVPTLAGVKMSVDEFAKEWDFIRISIGDGASVALSLIRPK